MKIRTKIQVFSLCWLLVTIMISNTFIYFIFSDRLTKHEQDEIQVQTENIANFITTVNKNAPVTAGLLRPYLPFGGMIRLVSESSNAFSVLTQRPELIEMDVQFLKGQYTTIVTNANKEMFAVSYFPIIWEDGSVVTLEVTQSLQAVQQTLRLLKLVLFIASVFILIPALFGGAILSKIMLRPIQLMAATMQDIQRKGVLKKIDLKTNSKDELYEVAVTFNNMVDLLKENIEKKQRFVQDASHELKTPLTVIESNASMLKRWGSKNQEILEESIEAIHSESQRMKQLTEQMLLLAGEQTVSDVLNEKINVGLFVHDVVSMMIKTYNREIKIIESDNEVIVMGDEQKLQQVLVILLDNAMKYSNEVITIEVGLEGNEGFFAVKDKGIGIPPDQLNKIFDRFYRVDSVRSRSTGGTGLGLAIAKTIIESHHGSIDVKSRENDGTIFTVKLPVSH